MELVSRNCPLCQKASEKLFADANYDFASLGEFAFASRKLPEYMHFRLLSCESCDILYASPILPSQSLAQLYRDADFDSSTESQFAAHAYGLGLKTFAGKLDRDFAVDIGAGDGTFLAELLDLGFKRVEGIEPSSKPIEQADARVKPHLKQGLFQRDLYPKNSVTLLTCFQTIEHLEDPLLLAQAAFEMLKPGGALMIVGHNKNALSAKLLGTKSPIFDIEHLQLFSKTGMETLLSRAGFSSVEVTPFHNTYPLHYWCKLFPFPNSIKAKMLPWMRNSALGKTSISLPAGNLMAVGFKA